MNGVHILYLVEIRKVYIFYSSSKSPHKSSWTFTELSQLSPGMFLFDTSTHYTSLRTVLVGIDNVGRFALNIHSDSGGLS